MLPNGYHQWFWQFIYYYLSNKCGLVHDDAITFWLIFCKSFYYFIWWHHQRYISYCWRYWNSSLCTKYYINMIEKENMCFLAETLNLTYNDKQKLMMFLTKTLQQQSDIIKDSTRINLNNISHSYFSERCLSKSFHFVDLRHVKHIICLMHWYLWLIFTNFPHDSRKGCEILQGQLSNNSCTD